MASADRSREAAALEALGELAVSDRREAIDHALEVAREFLGMDIAYFSEFTKGQQVIKGIQGEWGSAELSAGLGVPQEETYCRRMLAGELSNVVPDAQHDSRVSDLAATEQMGIGSYVGVPLQLSDGRVYGTLCCASADAKEALGSREVQFMRVLARLIADELERERNRLPRAQETTPAPPADPAGAAREAAQRDIPGAVLKLDLWFAVSAHAAAAVRSALEVVADHVDGDVLNDARLLATELVTNSVRHSGIGSGSSIGLALRLTPDRLSVAVSDPGPGFQPQITEPDPDQEGGRGLFIVDCVADRWGVGDAPVSPPRGSGVGTTVWFELGVASDREIAA